jgi:hypothetical protein
MAARHDAVVDFPTTNTAKITRLTPLSALPELLTPSEAAAWLGLGRDAGYQLARDRGVRVGRYLRARRVLEELVRGE